MNEVHSVVADRIERDDPLALLDFFYHRVLRLRTILRFVKDARAESGCENL